MPRKRSSGSVGVLACSARQLMTRLSRPGASGLAPFGAPFCVPDAAVESVPEAVAIDCSLPRDLAVPVRRTGPMYAIVLTAGRSGTPGRAPACQHHGVSEL